MISNSLSQENCSIPVAFFNASALDKVPGINSSFASTEKPNYGTEQIARSIIIEKYKQDILGVISNDEYEDGVVSRSEDYIRNNFSSTSAEFIKPALNDLYMKNLRNPHILTGLLIMVGSLSYEEIYPEGQMMAMGLLQNENYYVRDRAIQAFERWNSKKGLDVLKSLKCDKKWLQRYVDKVIIYIERDGKD